MQTELIGNLQYYLLSSANPPREYVNLHDRCFNSWLEIIQNAFAEVGNTSTEHLHDDFVRQNVVGCLCDGEQVVATFLHSFSSIHAKAARSFRYLKENYPDLYFQKLESLGIENVLSVHYLAVNPEWRRGNREIEIAPILMALSQRIRDEYNLDAVIGVYRRDRKVHEIAYALGGECIIANIPGHGTQNDLIVMNKNKPYQYPSAKIAAQVLALWENRIDTFQQNGLSGRKAA